MNLTDYAEFRSLQADVEHWFRGGTGAREWATWRRLMGLSLRQMADMLHVHHTYLYRIENGLTVPSLEVLGEFMKLVSEYESGVPIDDNNAPF